MKRHGWREEPDVVLLPLRPDYARPIMDGSTCVELRKTAFAHTPTHVLVYASSPVEKVLGSFEVAAVDIDCVEALWVRYADVGCITRDDFREYYAGRERGVALGVRHVVALADPLPLAALVLTGPLRSFMHVGHQVPDDLRQRSAPWPRRQ